MRPGLPALLLALSPCLLLSTVSAEEAPKTLVQIDDQLFTKHDELKAAQQAKEEQQALLDSKKSELDSLEQTAKSLDEAFSNAKSKLENAYQRMIDDPNTDLAGSQKSYQDAWSAVKQNQKARLAAEQELVETRNVFVTRQATLETIEQHIAELDENKIRARVEQLRGEIKQPQQISVSFTNRCQASLTLSQCDNQTKELALQKAVKQFRTEIAEQTSESAIVKRNINDASLNIHVIKHVTKQAGFYDGVRYRTIMNVELEARPKARVACDLLQVDTQYCFAPGTAHELQADQEMAWVTLAIRSNQFNDSVYIDGVSYGSTPVEIMLPIGLHDITVQKDGYKAFTQQVAVKSDTAIRAVLEEKSNPLRAGSKFADAMAGKGQAPEMIAILQGKYFTGENASKQVFLDHAFGIGATPVTVSQFATFVEHTNYQTDAELKNTCTALVNGEVTPIAKANWRDPGFKQYPNSPVVCVSQNDAKSYTNWLRKQTGAAYRLPTEEEWEVAARAGSQDKYWWGDKFVSGEANTGWSGTPWSNLSTSPVSAFKPNQLGLYDVVGNVWQWTSSPKGIAKGGAWNFSPEMAASDKQLFLSNFEAANYLGFRVVRDIN
ncbi:formylglycine-generating enzyme family protein [Vibrio bivalvicida]|uniref:SUMF1/EgtB/PvdO family nonheme iron enzyme n=1 Tax=Vibrio bivalvicida TaxID=1276888 RepID=A0ABV4MDX5_9VIBR